MVNKLRQTANAVGTFLLAAAAWGAVTYGSKTEVTQFVWVGLLGVTVAITPQVIARSRRYYGQARTEISGGSRTDDYYYVSVEPVKGHKRVLGTVRDAVKDANLDGVSEYDFPEGLGLSVAHSGFHNSFVRISFDERLVVSGASERTTKIVDLLRDRLDINFDRQWSNPMRRGYPVEGGSRVVLAAVFLIAAIGGGLAVADIGYSSEAYNPVEKAVLASHDVRAVVSPSVSQTDAAIAKAEFRVTTLREADVEVRWAGNDSESILSHGRDAVTIAATVRSTVTDLQDESLTADQRARVANIRADLRMAETNIAAPLSTSADDDSISRSGAGEIREIAAVLRNHRPGQGADSPFNSTTNTTATGAVGSAIRPLRSQGPSASYSNSVHGPLT